MKPEKITQLLHLDRISAGGNAAFRKPVARNLAFAFNKADDILAAFQGRKNAFTYSRAKNPTTKALENKLSLLEDAKDSIVFATGMGAIGSTFFALFSAGDHLIVTKYLFGNTRSLLLSMQKFGVEVDFVDVTKKNEVSDAVKSNTKAVFVETIANPRTQIADLTGIGEICKENRLLFILDNTMASPAGLVGKSVGASLVIHSLSKYVGGHGAVLGGSVSDTGLYDWDQFENIYPPYRENLGATTAGLKQIRKKGLRDFGATLSADNADLISLGMETLWLRFERACENALIIAEFLAGHPKVENVYYPGLENHPQHNRAAKMFNHFGALISFDLVDGFNQNQFVDNLNVIICATNLGDTRTLIIPVAETIFFEAGKEKRAEMGISDSLLRLSVGIESAKDLCEDVNQALGLL